MNMVQRTSNVVAPCDPVSLAASRIQALPPLKRALLAREALIQAAGGTVAFGPAESLLRKILAQTGRVGLVAVSFALLMKRYLAGHKSVLTGELPGALFVGIGAMRELQLHDDVAAELGVEPHFIDQRTPAGFAGLLTPGPIRVLSHWLRTTRDALSVLSQPNADFAPLDLLSTLAMRNHELAYLLAWFETLRDTRPAMPLVFSTADLPAHAACLADFAVEYRQHGFLSRALVFPEFSRMIALTAFEGRYVADRVPRLVLKVDTPHTEQAPVTATLAFAGDYVAHDPAPVVALADLALASGLRVVVRPHPRGFDELWSGIRGRDNVVFDTEGRFEDFLEKWRPAFLASWFSTTLLDGLHAGAVPITLASSTDRLVLPIKKIALSWPEEAPRIETCMRDDAERDRVYSRICSAI